MKILNITYQLALLLILAAMTGCADDKGSYDYAPENKIEIGGLKQEYRVISHETISPAPSPVLSFALGDADVSYSWRVDYKEVCTSPTLDVPIDASVGTHDASLVVTDNESHLRYFYDFTIQVETPYSQGLVVLSEGEDGRSLLSFQRRTTEGDIDDFVPDVFALENPDWGTLGQRPVALNMQSDTTYYLVLNKESDKVLTRLNVNTMKMEKAFTLSDIPNCSTPWNPTQMKTCYATTLILAGGKNITYNHSDCGRIATSATPDDYSLEWLDTGGGGDTGMGYSYTIGSGFPAYDGKTKQFVYTQQTAGGNFTYDAVYPYNEFPEYDPTAEGYSAYEPVYMTGLQLVAGEKMYNKADGTSSFGYSYPKELLSTAECFIFKDADGNAHFYTFNFDAALSQDFDWGTFSYIEVFKPLSTDYGVSHDRTVAGLTLDANTVVKALPNGKYWLIANGSAIHCEYYHDGGRTWDIRMPSEVRGNIVQMLPTSDETKLYVALYDPTSSSQYKGGIAVINIDMQSTGFGSLLEYYPNVCGKAVTLLEKTGLTSVSEEE